MLRLINYLFVIIMFLAVGLSAQTTCLLISESSGPAANDVVIKEWLEGKGYVVTVADDDLEIGDGTVWYTVDDLKAFDFGFVSESCGSGNTKMLKGAPIPLFYTELWASKTTITGWVPEETSGAYYENSAETTIKILKADHELAAGFSAGSEVAVVSAGGPDGAALTYSRPGVEHIAIAGIAADETQIVVMGIEAGTTLYTDAGVLDGSVVSENRVAAVGINATANANITEDAYKLIEAGIDWILTETAINEEPIAGPMNFELEQNYPNPFNPSTTIAFTLGENTHTLIKVYNVLGQEVATLVNQNLNAGPHTIQFNGSDLESGVYFYNIVAGDYQAYRKMMLIK